MPGRSTRSLAVIYEPSRTLGQGDGRLDDGIRGIYLAMGIRCIDVSLRRRPYRRSGQLLSGAWVRSRFSRQLHSMAASCDELRTTWHPDWLCGLLRNITNDGAASTEMTANNELEPTVNHRGPRLAAAMRFVAGGSTGR